MGVAVLQAYPPPPDKTVQQAVEILQRRILNLGATHTGQVSVISKCLLILSDYVTKLVVGALKLNLKPLLLPYPFWHTISVVAILVRPSFLSVPGRLRDVLLDPNSRPRAAQDLERAPQLW